MKAQRIQKVLANLGVASRRKVETMILSGEVTVNNHLAQLGQRITDNDKVKIKGHIIRFAESAPQKTRLIMYHKPEGLITTRHDPQQRPTVFEDLPKLDRGRWINVGRLDVNTSGLMLFTNNGELAHKLMHPSQHLEREYAVRIHGPVTNEIIQRLLQGVKLDDGMARFKKVIAGGGERTNQWYHVVVMEGRNRIVRRLWESQGVEVSRLMRIRFGGVVLPKSLRRGGWLELDPAIF